MRVRDLVKLLDQDGWIATVSQDDLRQFRRRGLRTRVTLGGALDDDLPDAYAEALLIHAQIKAGKA